MSSPPPHWHPEQKLVGFRYSICQNGVGTMGLQMLARAVPVVVLVPMPMPVPVPVPMHAHAHAHAHAHVPVPVHVHVCESEKHSPVCESEKPDAHLHQDASCPTVYLKTLIGQCNSYTQIYTLHGPLLARQGAMRAKST